MYEQEWLNIDMDELKNHLNGVPVKYLTESFSITSSDDEIIIERSLTIGDVIKMIPKINDNSIYYRVVSLKELLMISDCVVLYKMISRIDKAVLQFLDMSPGSIIIHYKVRAIL